jgi:hypothetical protein
MTTWPINTPATCPFKESPDFSGLDFTGRHAEYTGADTWYRQKSDFLSIIINSRPEGSWPWL